MTAQYFISKQDSIQKAINRIQSKLEHYSNESAKIQGNWTDADRERFKDWNNLHDLEYRLTSRLSDNYSNYQQWHFDTFGWVAY